MNLTELGLTPTQHAEAEQLDPDYVAAWLEQLANTAGIRAPAAWFMAAIRTGRLPGEQTSSDKERATRLAETWIRNAGLYEPTEESLLAALFDQGCRLHPWQDDPALRQRIVEFWQTQQPRAEQAERDKLERAARHQAMRETTPAQ